MSARLGSRLLLVLAVGAAIWGMKGAFSEGWCREDWLGRNGARYSIIARNYLRTDWTETYGAPLISSGDPAVVPREFYTHHPPLLSFTLAGAFSLFDETEDVARATVALFTLLNILLIYRLGSLWIGSLGGGLSAFAFAIVPATGVYGAHVDVQGPQVITFVLATFLGAYSYARYRHRRALIGACVAMGFGLLSDWPAYYLGGILPMLVLGFEPKGEGKKWLGLFPLLALGGFLLLRVQAGLLGLEGGGFGNSLQVRTFDFYEKLASDPDRVRRAFENWSANMGELFPWPWLGLGVLGLFYRPMKPHRAWMIALAGVGAIHLVLFPGGALVHDYWAFAIVPGWALFVGAGLTQLAKWGRIPERLRWGVLALILALISVQALAITKERHERRDVRHLLLGRALQSVSEPGDIVLTNAPYNPAEGQGLTYPQFSYYADRYVVGGIDSPQKLDPIIEERSATCFFLLPPMLFPGVIQDADYAALESALKERGEVRELDAGVKIFSLRED